MSCAAACRRCLAGSNVEGTRHAADLGTSRTQVETSSLICFNSSYLTGKASYSTAPDSPGRPFDEFGQACLNLERISV